MRYIRPAAAIVAALVLVLTGSPAHAGTRERTDAVGDMTARNCFVTPESTPDYVCTWQPVPHRTNGDITFVRVRHLSDRVVVFTRFQRLYRVDGGQALRVRIWLPNGTGRTVHLDRDGGPMSIDMEHSDGEEVVCMGMRHATDWERDTMRVVIPRACLADANWIRVGVRSELWPRQTWPNYYVDEGFRSRPTTSETYGLSGRIYRG